MNKVVRFWARLLVTNYAIITDQLLQINQLKQGSLQ